MEQSWSSADFSTGFKMGVKRRRGAQKKRKRSPRVMWGLLMGELGFKSVSVFLKKEWELSVFGDTGSGGF